MKKVIFIGSVLATSLVLTAGVLISINALKPKTAIPEEIRSQLSFTPLVVTPNSNIKVDGRTFKYDPGQKGLSFVTHSLDVGQLTFSEQATPQEFNDIPDLYKKLIDNLNRYSSFDSQFGTIYLTKPKDQKTGQSAVMNGRGVLLFIRSHQDLSDDQWRQVFNSLEIAK